MIRGSQIHLRPVALADLPQLDAWASDPDFLSEYNNFGLTSPNSYSQRFTGEGLLTDRQSTLLVVLPDGTAVGDVSFHEVGYGPGWSNRAYNIGIALVPVYRGQGYGSEAQRLLAAYLFATYPIMRVEASTDVTNLPEQHALEKAGFTREGILRKAQWRGGSWHDLMVYSKLRGEE
jgi:aminoglycoside 6'-N-acetyltransferase